MKKFIIKTKWLWIICSILVLLILCFAVSKIIYIKSADTSWIEDLGYKADELHTLKLDRAGCPMIPIEFDKKIYYFNFDTGCASDVVVTNVLENKIDYTILGQTEQLNRDGSHRGWSYTVNINELVFFDSVHNNLNCSMIDWKMSSSYKFNGLIGAGLFDNMVVTMDYRARLIGVSNEALDCSGLSKEQYAVAPMLQTQTEGQENLIFFECKLNGENVIVYIDTGKNVSYIHDPNSEYIIGESTDKPNTACVDAVIDVGNLSLTLSNVYEANIPQYSDFAYPMAIELNSDQYLKNDIVITFDFINNNLIFFKR